MRESEETCNKDDLRGKYNDALHRFNNSRPIVNMSAEAGVFGPMRYRFNCCMKLIEDGDRDGFLSRFFSDTQEEGDRIKLQGLIGAFEGHLKWAKAELNDGTLRYEPLRGQVEALSDILDILKVFLE